MKNESNLKKTWKKRVVSIVMTLVLAFSDLDLAGISFLRDILEIPEMVKAEATYDTSKFSNITSMTLGQNDFAEYSRCYAGDANFASEHANDSITLNPTGYFKLESDGDNKYVPLGTAASPFGGTIRVNQLAEDQSFILLMDVPLFNIVYDSVQIYGGSGTDAAALEFIKMVSDTEPLLAREVRHDSASAGPRASWKAILSNDTIQETIDGNQITYANFSTYGGVIGKMMENASITLDYTDNSTNALAVVKRDNSQGCLCGEMNCGATLTASYTKTTNRQISVGDGTNAISGGLVGHIKGATFELTAVSGLNFSVNSGNSAAGLIAGKVETATADESTVPSSIKLFEGASFSGTVTSSSEYAGGIIGYLEKSDISIGSTGAGTVTLSGVTVTGTNKTGGAIGYFEPSSATSNALTQITYNMTNCEISGNNPGGIFGVYKAFGGESINVSKFVFTNTKLKAGNAGGVFGIYEANGNSEITGTFNAPESSVPYGGIIGEYKNSVLTCELNLNALTVNTLKQTTSGKKLGGVILNVSGSSYIKVDGLTVNVTGGADNCDSTNPFGGIVSTIGASADKGSFIDITGDYSLSTNKAYKGGAIAGSFKNGVLRLAGTTDISAAQTENGYGQLIFENDCTLVYSKGTGEDTSWTLKRNASSKASDLGIWGEVVRFSDMETDIVTIDTSAHTVTLNAASTAVTNSTNFAKLALNMQLNDALDHGALLFDDKTTSPKSILLDGEITVNGTINLSGTGLLGFMRDGGKSFPSDVDFFTGSIEKANGAEKAEIILASGELYGTYPPEKTGTGGKIYLANNDGHNAQGLFAFSKGAEVNEVTVGGSINIERNAGSGYLYVGALFGAMTNGATLSDVTITTTLDVTKADNAYFFIGGIAGVFDGSETAANPYVLSVTDSCSIKPTINLYGKIGCTESSTTSNVGGVLGALKGAEATKYNVSISDSEVSPKITIGADVADVDSSYLGGMIGRVVGNKTNERKIDINSVTMNEASVQTKAKYAGGLLGAIWERTLVTIDGLEITDSSVTHKYSQDDSKQSGLVFQGTGKWDIESLGISSSNFSSESTAPASFGLIVNEAYSGDDGLYINLKNCGYSLTNVTIPSSTASNYYVDEIAANSADTADKVVSGGKGTGIININMNTDSGTNTKVTDTGTYQNKILNNNKLIANQHARYYYNLDVIKAKQSPSDGEQFLMWSIYNYYAASNIKNYGVLLNSSITGLTAVDLSGLSYYPVNIQGVTLPAATYTLGFQAIKTKEASATDNSDNWKRNPDATGNMTNTTETTRRNQHYLMQNGLFGDVTGELKTAGSITLAGDFGGVNDAGVLVGNELTGNVNLTKGVTLSGIKPSVSDSPMLINYINGLSTEVNPKVKLTTLRQSNYPTSGTTEVASALINKAEGTGMQIVFSDIKLDARDGADNAGMTSSATTAMNKAYGTSRSIFKDATLIKTLKSNSSDIIEYNYTWDEDWGIVKVNGEDVNKRNVTYGKEVNVAINANYPYYYKAEELDVGETGVKSGERRYSGTKRRFTNPINGDDTQFDFSTGFLPYVANKATDSTYDICEVKVNFVSTGLVDGCGTYNDPYIITSPKLLTKVANYINSGNAMLDIIRLPNALNSSWHETSTGDSLYKKSTTDATDYVVSDSSDTLAIEDWNQTTAREYLAGAYYVIPGDLTLTSDFPGIGKGGSSENGKTVFHGAIIGQKNENNEYPTITNNTSNPFIYISNGTVIKNLNFKIDNVTNSQSAITITQANAGSGSDYTYSYKDITSADKTAKYYGGIFGEIMGGDNIIDGVTVTYTANRPIKVTGNNKQLVAVGGFVGAVVNGALIFRGTNSVTGFTVYDNDLTTNALAANHTKTIYANPYVGRVINGYAVNEGSSTLNNTTKHYTIDSITPPSEANKLDVNGSSISIPNAQALFVMSLITQSTAGTATSASGDYGVSQSYGVNNGVFCGSNRLGTYADVGKKHEVEGESVIYTTKSDISDYNDKAIKDVANATDTVRGTAIPYIISAYTKAVDGAYPARTITYDNTKFWDITLSENGSFDLSAYPSFRGIGCMGNKATIYNMKIGMFDGNGRTIKLSILESRYGRNAENYYHQENFSRTTVFSGETLDAYNYGHDQNLYKLMGLGLFDNVSVKKDSTHQYQFKHFTLKGKIEEKVYNKDGNDITGTNDQSQLFCIGGVVGKRVNFDETNTRRGDDYDKGNKSDLNFRDISFDGLKISGSYSCGGLIGLDALNYHQEMNIVNCNSTQNGVEVIGGFYGKSNDKSLRHGVGSFVGMTFQCRPIIDGDNSETADIEKADISVAKVDTYYTENENRCNVGGLIGYSGTGATIMNINLKAANENAVIGSEKAANSSGFIAFGQYASTAANDYLKNSIYIVNCTLDNVSVKAKNSASGFYGRCNNEGYGPRYIYLSDCAVIGNGSVEIKAYGTDTTENVSYAGGLLACSNATGRSDNIIQNSYVSGYKIEGFYVGGMVGRVVNNPLNLKNVYVKGCSINTYKNADGYAGGFIGYSAQNLYGYNMRTENLTFKLRDGSDNTAKAGAFVGNSTSKIDKFVAVAKYHSEISKIPSADIKSGTNANNIIVFSDYTGQSLAEAKNTVNISSFGKTDAGGNITDQNKVPYLTLNPSSAMGTGEFISSDGAYQLSDALTGYSSYTSGKSAAARIYADWNAGSAFSNVTISAPYSGATVLSKAQIGAFFQRSTDSGDFKVSTWNTEMGAISGVDDFTLLVVNDANDPEQTTNFIDNYIRLMTGTTTHYMEDVSGKYRIVINACRYNSNNGKFELQNGVIPGLSKAKPGTLNNTDGKTYTNGYYQMNLAHADSKYENQFTLIDVQYYDPTDTASDNNKRIAYHLYVPVYTRKTVNIEFTAASISGSEYKASAYVSRILSEIAKGKNANDPTQIVDAMDVWTTTYIRYTYPADQVNEILKLGSDLQWNHDKQFSIVRTREHNVPAGTKMVLVDPNNDMDTVYYCTMGASPVDERVIDLSSFNTRLNGSGSNFHEQTLYSMIYNKVKSVDRGTSGTYNLVSAGTEGAIKFVISGEDRYFKFVGSGGQYDLEVDDAISEDYYISLYVPKETGQADVIRFQPSGTLGTVNASGGAASGNVIRATVTSKLNAALIIGDFYNHTVDSFSLSSPLDNNVVSDTNKTLTASTTATIELVGDTNQKAYFANVLSDSSIHLYHSFNIQLIKYDTQAPQSDIINGIEKKNISATYTINGGAEASVSTDGIVREPTYIQCTTGDIKSELIKAANNYKVVIVGEAILDFVDYADYFPSNPDETDGIGVKGAVRSNVSYQVSDLPYSKMNAKKDPVSPFYYMKDEDTVMFTFDAIDELDEEEIGTATKNNSKLGVNDYFTYTNVINGKSIYNATEVKDYARATSIEYTLELYRKTTVGNETKYMQVNISDYLDDVTLTDPEINAETGNLVKSTVKKTVKNTQGNDIEVNTYVYSRNLDMSGADQDAIFYTDFSCKVLKDGDFLKKEYANYRIVLTVNLKANNTSKDQRSAYIVYTLAKIDPTMIDEIVSAGN